LPFYLTEQKCCQPLEILTHFFKNLDLLMLEILGLKIKGLQKYGPSSFENDSTSCDLESGPTGSSVAGAG